jgi:L-alanine-DL-glutamate epimerase-like enolase superfamily enzyme
MARKVAACCEFFNVRTAWHGLQRLPVGHAVNMHLIWPVQFRNPGAERASYGARGVSVRRRSRRLHVLNDQPGLGVDIDEKLAARSYRSPGAAAATTAV